MIDFEQATRDQEDLDALCAWDVTAPTVELFSFNRSYGFSRVLKEYSGYPMDRPVEAVIPHGIYLNANSMLDHERDSGLPAVLNYPAFRSRIWEQETDKVMIPSASPFLYALSMFRDRFPKRTDASGTIFFPAHTIQTTRTNASWDEVADELLELDERFQPITVCMHHVDYTKGLHRPFSKKGMRVVCAGDSHDPEFIYRWLHLVSTHEHAASNDVGSAVIYAAEAGMSIKILSQVVNHLVDPALQVLVRPELVAQAEETKRRIVELFRDDADESAVSRVEVAHYLLGAENMKAPEGLKADLEYVASLNRAD